MFITKRGSLKTWLWFAVLMAALGYLALLSMPAEHHKGAELTVLAMLINFKNATTMLEVHGQQLLIIWVVLFILSLSVKVSPERCLISALFLLGGIVANYTLVVASYYPDRCFCTTLLLLLLSVALLAAELWQTKYMLLCRCGAGILAVFCFFAVIYGSGDVASAYKNFHIREELIASYKAEGKTNIVLDSHLPFISKYNPYQGLEYLDTEDARAWPNHSLAEYYGVDSILGRLPDEDAP